MNLQLTPTLFDFQVALNLGETALLIAMDDCLSDRLKLLPSQNV